MLIHQLTQEVAKDYISGNCISTPLYTCTDILGGTLLRPEGGGGTNIFSPHFKMAAAKVNSSFLKDILKLTASRVLKLGGVGRSEKQIHKKI